MAPALDPLRPRRARRDPVRGRSLGRPFAWLWAASAASAAGTWLAFDAFPLIAILVLDAGPGAVSALAAAGLAAGTALALPLGPWVERRRTRRVMIAADLLRAAALLTVPAAYALDRLSLGQLLAVAVLVRAADVAFRAASGACLKALVAPQDLLAANGRLEATTWTASAVGPPLGGAAVGALGPVATVAANAASFVASAAAIRAIGPEEARPVAARRGARAADLLAGWRCIAADPVLRALLANTLAVNALIMATAPLAAVRMLGELGFAPWEYALAFAAPCVGGLVGARAAPTLVARHGRRAVLRRAGALRACWSLGPALAVPGTAGLALVFALQLALVTCAGAFNPVLATERLERAPDDRVARVLAAWTIAGGAATAAATAALGALAAVTSPRAAIAVAGLLLFATPLLLPRAARPGGGAARG